MFEPEDCEGLKPRTQYVHTAEDEERLHNTNDKRR